MSPPLLIIAATGIDWLLSALLLAADVPWGVSHLAGFCTGALLFWIVAARRLPPAMRRRALLAALLAICLRGALLALLVYRLGWLVPVALLPASLVSVLVTQYATRPDWKDACLALISAALIMRVLYAASIELMPEETYYWNYARHLDIGYLDHPPMVAWLIRGCVELFGDTAFGVRAAALLSSLVASLFIYRLTRRIFGEAAALNALLLAQVLPFFFMAGFITTPDAPLTAAWAASLYFLERALVNSESRAWWRGGVALGLGLISKYTVLLVGASTALCMLFFDFGRRWWLRYQPYAAAILALLLFSPVIIWNWQHEWASFTFQTTRRLAEAPRFSLHKLILSALVLITPIGVMALIPALRRHTEALRSRQFLSVTVLLPLVIFTLYSLRHEVKLDWTGAPWIGILPLIAADMRQSSAASSKLKSWLTRAWPKTLGVTLVLLGFGLYYLALGFPGIPTRGPIELVPVGWRSLAAQSIAVADKSANAGERVVLVGMDRYAIASELAFYAREQHRADVEITSVHLFEGMGLMYERWAPAAKFEQRTLMLIATRESDLSSPLIEAHTMSLGPVQSFALERDGKLVRRIYYRLAYGYHVASSATIP